VHIAPAGARQIDAFISDLVIEDKAVDAGRKRAFNTARRSEGSTVKRRLQKKA